MSKGKATARISSSPPATLPLWERGEWPWLLFIFAAVFVSFLPTLWNGFVDWDDGANYLDNPHYRGFSPKHLKWMFTTFFAGPYQPLSWVTLGFDYLVWGLNPTGYHLTNLLLHCANGVALFFLLKAFLHREGFFPSLAGTFQFKAACTVGALAFALHPMRVESVAWATERRDVLSGLFYILTVVAYVRWSEEAPRRRWYFLTLVFYVLSCLSKAWGMTLPAVLLVLDVYPLKRLTPGPAWKMAAKKLLLEKIPFFALALLFAGLAFYGQKIYAMRKVSDHGLFERVVQSAYGLAFYPAKTLWPDDLSPLYLLSAFFNPLDPKYLVGALAGVVVTIALVCLRKRWPWALAAWLCYAITVSPVLGLTQSGDQVVADRYAYLSCLSFAVLAGAGLLCAASSPRWKLAAGLAGILLCALAVLTFRQTRVWHDKFTLWEHALRADPDNYIAYLNVTANRKSAVGRSTDPADDDSPFPDRPAMAFLYNNRGLKRAGRGDKTNAITDYTKALAMQPKYAEAYYNRGLLRAELGQTNAALADYKAATVARPNYGLAWLNHGVLREKLGDVNGAIEDYNTALRVDSTVHQAHLNRGNILLARGDAAGARADYDAALALEPRYTIAYLNRGILLLKQQNNAEAAKDFAKALEVAPPNWFARGQAEQLLTLARSPATAPK
ncbi:MAG: tetratricopeptide repeat protein [Verrucomicrobia bacterium]|nr:tetratricopeptide repeat protein [Verrucomicrobiota bacterium]